MGHLWFPEERLQVGERCGPDMSALPCSFPPTAWLFAGHCTRSECQGFTVCPVLGSAVGAEAAGMSNHDSTASLHTPAASFAFPKNSPHSCGQDSWAALWWDADNNKQITETPFVAWASTSKTLWSFHQVGGEPRPTEPPSLSQCEPHMAPIVAASDSRWV